MPLRAHHPCQRLDPSKRQVTDFIIGIWKKYVYAKEVTSPPEHETYRISRDVKETVLPKLIDVAISSRLCLFAGYDQIQTVVHVNFIPGSFLDLTNRLQ